MKIALFLLIALAAIAHCGTVPNKKDNVFGVGTAVELEEVDEGLVSARGRNSEENDSDDDSSNSSSSESGSEESGENGPPTTTTRRTTTRKPTTTRRTTTTRRPPTTTPTTPRPTTTTTTTTTQRPTTTTTTTPRPTTTTTTTTTPRPTTTPTTTTTTPRPTTTTPPPPPPSTTTDLPGECKIICRVGDHYLVNPANCNSFYQCSNGTPIYQPCPPDLVFDPRINVCVTRDTYNCVETCDRVEVLYRTRAG